MIKTWINDLNTTSVRILVSCLIAASLSHIVVIAMVWRGYEPTKMHLTVLTGILFGILTMMGFDTISFVSKRFSDREYAAAKNPPVQVVAEPPSVVKIEGDAVQTIPTPPPSSSPPASGALMERSD